jgi:hypothetical protein
MASTSNQWCREWCARRCRASAAADATTAATWRATFYRYPQPSHAQSQLYPKADAARKVLLYACRACDYEEVAASCVTRAGLTLPRADRVPTDHACAYAAPIFATALTPCSYRNELIISARASAGVVKDVSSDSTLVRRALAPCERTS